MIQLVGYYTVKSTTNNLITKKDVKNGIVNAKKRLGSLVHLSSLNELSDIDKSFLSIMASSFTPIKTTNIAKKMGVSNQYIQKYRERLLKTGLIYAVKYGELDFSIPYLKEYLQNHVSSKIL
jgi:ribosomal protein L7Ae-like RNA K-turn-binding protein